VYEFDQTARSGWGNQVRLGRLALVRVKARALRPISVAAASAAEHSCSPGVTRTQRAVPVQACAAGQVMDMSLYFFLAVVHHRAFFVKWDHPVAPVAPNP
jgi:hypothetical protein